MSKEPREVQLGDWRLLVRDPEGRGPHPVIFLIHGWTGDERSMWVFASRLPKNALLLAPRAPYPSISDGYGGYSWVQQRSSSLSTVADFSSGQTLFNDLLTELPKILKADYSKFSIIGFSQGAAFSYAYALNHPSRINKLAGLAGFLPEGCKDLATGEPLMGKDVYIAHGSRDETVPVAHAREAKKVMALAGAEVRYCEDDIGHKLGAQCFTQLADFFA